MATAILSCKQLNQGIKIKTQLFKEGKKFNLITFLFGLCIFGSKMLINSCSDRLKSTGDLISLKSWIS